MLGHFFTGRKAWQKVTIAGTHAESSAFQATTHWIELTSTVDCYIDIGTAPVADNTKFYMIASVPRRFGVEVGKSEKVSCLQVGSGGVLSIAEGEQL